MFIYNVTVKVESQRAQEWLDWMRNVHIPDVLNTGYFTENRICRIVNDEDSEDFTFAIQYTCSTMENYQAYQIKSAPQLQNDHRVKFGNDALAFRTLMEVL